MLCVSHLSLILFISPAYIFFVEDKNIIQRLSVFELRNSPSYCFFSLNYYRNCNPGSLEKCGWHNISAKWYYIACCMLCNYFIAKCPVSWAKRPFSYPKQMNENLSIFYDFGCCMHHSSLKITFWWVAGKVNSLTHLKIMYHLSYF